MSPWILNIVNPLKKITINPQLSICLYTGKPSYEKCLEIYDSIMENIQKIIENLSDKFKKKCNPIEKFFNKPKEIKYPKALFCPVSESEYRSLVKNKQEILKTHSCLFLYLLTEWIAFLQKEFQRMKCKQLLLSPQKEEIKEIFYKKKIPY